MPDLDENVFSDEPSRVRLLVSEFLSGQTGSTLGEDGSAVTLVAGADVGDDCAVYEISEHTSLVVGSDYVRGPKFILYELGLLSEYDLGYYLVAANVSDIAAMGATPIGVLSVVRYPADMNDGSFRQVMAGIHQACTDFGTLSVGGDIGNAERLILSGTALGVCSPEQVLLRKGAQPGDLLCVTGPCGVLGAAVAYFPRKEAESWSLSSEVEEQLLDSWRRPRAKVPEGRLLSRKPYATSCQDTSDGLKATIEQLMRASGVGFSVSAAMVPLDPAVVAVAGLMEVDPLTLAMSASSDFQLAFTISPDDVEACEREFKASGLSFVVIGEATDSGRAELVDGSGTATPLPGVAWRHQQSDISTLVDSPKKAR